MRGVRRGALVLQHDEKGKLNGHFSVTWGGVGTFKTKFALRNL